MPYPGPLTFPAGPGFSMTVAAPTSLLLYPTPTVLYPSPTTYPGAESIPGAARMTLTPVAP